MKEKVKNHLLKITGLAALALTLFWGATAGAEPARGQGPAPEIRKKMTLEQKKKLEKLKKNASLALRTQQTENNLKAAEVNQQIQNILRINEALKADKPQQAAEIQRISEQAHIHQQILQNLNSVKTQPPAVTPTDVDEILRQEKIRLIREQTQQNRQLLETLERSRRR